MCDSVDSTCWVMCKSKALSYSSSSIRHNRRCLSRQHNKLFMQSRDTEPFTIMLCKSHDSFTWKIGNYHLKTYNCFLHENDHLNQDGSHVIMWYRAASVCEAWQPFALLLTNVKLQGFSFCWFSIIAALSQEKSNHLMSSASSANKQY